MRRHTIGVIAILLLAVGLSQLVLYGTTLRGNSAMFVASSIRIGLVLGAVWLAWPQVARLVSGISLGPLLIGLVGIVAVAARPKLLVIVGPALLVLAGLHLAGLFTRRSAEQKKGEPKRKNRATGRPRSNESKRRSVSESAKPGARRQTSSKKAAGRTESDSPADRDSC